jgi:hypothetical protein
MRLVKTAHMLRHACGFKMANDGVDSRLAGSVPMPDV